MDIIVIFHFIGGGILIGDLVVTHIIAIITMVIIGTHIIPLMIIKVIMEIIIMVTIKKQTTLNEI